MPNTIRDVEKLGYMVGFAHGSVQAEVDALTLAKANADPGVLAEQAATVTAETVAQLRDAGRLPSDDAERRELWAQIGEAAFEQLTTRADEAVAFHTRALELSKEMPDVWVLSGPGIINVYVACKPDGTGWDDDQQALLDALVDPDAHKERCFQHHAPDEIVALALEARALGADVDGTADEKAWTLKVDGKKVAKVEELEAHVAPLRPADVP